MDFFIDEEENINAPTLTAITQPKVESTNKPATGASVSDVASSMNAIKQLITPELVQKINEYLYKVF